MSKAFGKRSASGQRSPSPQRVPRRSTARPGQAPPIRPRGQQDPDGSSSSAPGASTSAPVLAWKDRKSRERSKFTLRRPGDVNELEAQQTNLQQRHQAAAAEEAAQVQAALKDAPPCTVGTACACPAPEWKLHPDGLTSMYHGTKGIDYVEVPQYHCSSCKKVAFPHPFAAGCMATTPERPTTLIALDLIRQFKHLHLLKGLAAESERGLHVL